MKNYLAIPLLLGTLVGTVSCQTAPEAAPHGASGSSASSAGAAPAGGGTGNSGSGGSGGTGQAGSSVSSFGGTSASSAGTASLGGAGGLPAGQGGVPAGGTTGVAGAGGVELPPLEECQAQASIDRLTSWVASGEGLTVPATGSILVKEGADYVGKVQFVGSEWHVIPVLIANHFGDTADLSTSAGITLTYSATKELHVQLRSESHWSGGDQYATTIPATNGQTETRFFSFAPAGWQSLFGAPALSYADTLKEGMGLVFVGNSDNTVVFYGMRIDGFTPPCQ